MEKIKRKNFQLTTTKLFNFSTMFASSEKSPLSSCLESDGTSGTNTTLMAWTLKLKTNIVCYLKRCHFEKVSCDLMTYILNHSRYNFPGCYFAVFTISYLLTIGMIKSGNVKEPKIDGRNSADFLFGFFKIWFAFSLAPNYSMLMRFEFRANGMIRQWRCFRSLIKMILCFQSMLIFIAREKSLTSSPNSLIAQIAP